MRPIDHAWSLLKEEPYQGLSLDDFDPQKVTGEVTDVNSPLATPEAPQQPQQPSHNWSMTSQPWKGFTLAEMKQGGLMGFLNRKKEAQQQSSQSSQSSQPSTPQTTQQQGGQNGQIAGLFDQLAALFRGGQS